MLAPAMERGVPEKRMAPDVPDWNCRFPEALTLAAKFMKLEVPALATSETFPPAATRLFTVMESKPEIEMLFVTTLIPAVPIATPDPAKSDPVMV